MPTIRESLTVPGDAEAVFAELADFRNTADWDPGVRWSRRTTGDGDVVVGTGVAVGIAAGPATLPITYVVTQLAEPRRVVFEARNGWSRARDVVDVEPLASGGSRITREATFALRGVLAPLNPLLALGFQQVGAKAIAGLAAHLGADHATA